MPRRFSGSSAVPEQLEEARLAAWLRDLRRALGVPAPDRRQGLHGVSRSGAEALRREPGLADVLASPSLSDPLTGFYRRSHGKGTGVTDSRKALVSAS